MKHIGADEIFSSIVSKDGRSSGFWKGLQLESVYQPIFGISQKRVVGFEALVRGNDAHGNALSPAKIFSLARTEEDLIFLDRLLRAIHILNFKSYQEDPAWLFLNVEPTVAINGRKFGAYFEELLSQTGVRGDQLVIEVVESTITSNIELENAADYYRSYGCLIAVDDFGAGHSNFDRIWSIKPEIVKLDRTMIVQASKRPEIRRILPEIVSLIRASGSLCLIEGIETPGECLLALETDIDFVQGFYFALPEKEPYGKKTSEFSVLLSKNRALLSRQQEPIEIRTLQSSFEEITRYALHEKVSDLLNPLFTNYPFVARYFALDRSGCQIGSTRERENRPKTDRRFLPITGRANTDWSHRAYFREAINHIGASYLSSPYLSTTGIHICRTLSIAIEKQGIIYVYCLDIEWNGGGNPLQTMPS